MHSVDGRRRCGGEGKSGGTVATCQFLRTPAQQANAEAERETLQGEPQAPNVNPPSRNPRSRSSYPVCSFHDCQHFN